MFRLRDLTAAYLAARDRNCPADSVYCQIGGCTMEVCTQSVLCCMTMGSCMPCSAQSDGGCPGISDRQFTEITEQILRRNTDAYVLNQLHEELRQLSEMAGARSQEILEFLRGTRADGAGPSDSGSSD